MSVRLHAISLRLTVFFAGIIVLVASGFATDIPEMLGGGNVTLDRDPSNAEAKLQVLQSLGAGMCRIPVDENRYYSSRDKRPLPEAYDALILAAHRHRVRPMFLFEYYTRWNGELGGREKWFAIGQAFAERFAPGSAWLKTQGIENWGVSFYSAINEPTWKSNNPTPIPPEQYATALEALADGVHSVDPSLAVSPGGYIEGSLFANTNPYIKAVAPLFNQGKLAAIDIHRYWDVKWVPMAGTTRFSLQSQFDQVKRDAGIAADVKFYTTEMNFKKREISEDEAACGFLTAIWDALGVVDADGHPVTQFVLPWNIFHLTTKDENYGLAAQLGPWTPTARGRVLQTVCRLTQGMHFVHCDPRRRGLFILEGDSKKLWVWQNRQAWTDKPGTSYRLEDIPTWATKLEIHRWNGLRKVVPLSGQPSIALGDLPQEEALMFLAHGSAGEP